MTRKDFEMIASILAESKDLEDAKRRFAGTLSQTNQRFDADRFLQAAKLDIERK